jgi:hypothetical protein
MEAYMVARGKIRPIELSTKDIWEYWESYLEEMYKMVAILKTPGKKAKSYEQQYCRTMFFEKCEKFAIDGRTFEITNNTQVEIWRCKEKLVDIYNYFDPDMLDM